LLCGYIIEISTGLAVLSPLLKAQPGSSSGAGSLRTGALSLLVFGFVGSVFFDLF
jgi:hypothetical protein